MLTKKQLFAVKIVRHLHILAGRILDTADVVESRIVISE